MVELSGSAGRASAARRIARRIWTAAGVREGLLEQQVSLGWGLVALGLIAVARMGCVRGRRESASLARFRSSSSSPSPRSSARCRRSGRSAAFTFVRPSALLYDVVPMFRVVRAVRRRRAAHGGAAGGHRRRSLSPRRHQARADRVRRARGARRRRIRRVAAGAVARRAARRRRTAGSTQQPGRVRALDCTPLNPESESVQWLTGYRVTLLGGSIDDCTEPNLRRQACGDWLHAPARAARRCRRTMVRDAPGAGGTARRRAFRRWARCSRSRRGTPRSTRHDGRILSARARRGVDVAMDGRRRGLDDREHRAPADRRDPRPRNVGVPPCAPHGRCGSTAATVADARRRAVTRASTRSVRSRCAAGDHELAFHPAEAPTVADDVVGNGDPRALVVCLRRRGLDRDGVSSRDAASRVTGISGPGSANAFPTSAARRRRATTRTTSSVCSPSTSRRSTG